ncbi:hypothetical protein AXG93_3802s1110 [Marchantia polymorpha subsp. ruderalis]|uniref:Uncharacterized protein n=1 Tax=Marchantia polymorpha subsp. ruderalis TaxID=1480154 RepID=A0A176VGW2_MARPO|nr:hypothetical protein AXG93_3802s1110 [Marchantia polymorpha subsp. ruderalis]
MGLLTREEEKQFLREREILTAESSEGTEDKNQPPSIPTHTTARGSVQVDMVQRRKKPERRLANKRKVVSDDEEELAHERREDSSTNCEHIRSRNERVDAARGDRRIFGGVNQSSSRHTGRTFEGETELISPISLSSELTRFARGEETPQLKMNEDVVRPEEEKKASGEDAKKVTVDLIARLEKSRKPYDEAVKRSERLIITVEKREKNYIKELAKLEARRAEEVRIAKELRGRIVEAKMAEEALCSKILEIEGKCHMEFRRAEELSAITGQLGKADMRSQESQRRMEKAEEAYRQLRDESTDELKLRLEKCLNGFAMWGLQSMKWLKLDLLERRLMSANTSGFAGHK